MAAIPSYAAAPRTGLGQVTAANPNRDGTGTIVSIFAAGASGSRIDAIALKATAATTAGMLRLFLHDGVNAHLLTEVPVLAQTPSATAPAWELSVTTQGMSPLLPLILPSGYSLRASTEKAEVFNVIAVGGDF